MHQPLFACAGLLLTIGSLLLAGVLPQAAPVTKPTIPEPPVWDGTLRRIKVPILMYHYVSPLPSDADEIRIDLTVHPDVFRSHIQYLSSAGYHTISLYQLHEALFQGTPLPPMPIVLTFDDGYVDHYTYVFPVLQEFDFTATFFVITGRADSGDPAHLSWAQIQAMAAAGMSMETHTRSHLDLRSRDRDFLIYEVLGSMQSLSAHTDTTPMLFAYPGGRYDDATLAVLQELGVWRAVTTQPGILHTTDNLLELTRVRIHNDTGVPGLVNVLGRL